MKSDTKKSYMIPRCTSVQISTETIIAVNKADQQVIQLGGQDTNASPDAGGRVWADVKGNYVNWDETE